MKFLVDRMLGKLAKKLRILGYDAVYYRGNRTHELVHLAQQEERVILTRNTKLFPGAPSNRIFRVTEDKPLLQVQELLRKGLISPEEKKLFSKCLVCNATLNEIPRDEADGKVPEFIFYEQKEFFRCPQCQRIYWQGTHHKKMKKKVEELLRVGDGRSDLHAD